MKKSFGFALSLILILCLGACSNNINEDNNTPPTLNSNGQNNTQQGRVINVTSPKFELSDGFIVPIEKKTSAPDGFISISTAEDFDKIKLNPSGNYILMSDIDLSQEGHRASIDGGTVDGNGYKIIGLDKDIWLFDELKNGAVLKNLGVELNGGELVSEAKNDSTIENCFTFGFVNVITSGLTEHRGAIASHLENASVINCYNLAKFFYKSIKEYKEYSDDFFINYIGGIAGRLNNSNIENCYNEGEINSEQARVACGIVALCSSGSIKNCYNSGNITVSLSAAGIGGDKIENCYNMGNIVSTYKDERVSITSEGVFGIGGNQVKNCYNYGALESWMNASGISHGNEATVTASYNVGKTTSQNAGAISSSKNLENCYFLDNVANATPDGALFATVKKLTESQMKDKTSFVGFDFDAVWEMGSGDYPYPVFKAIYE